MWDPVQYRRFGDERARPFFDLMARVGAERPRLVADLGCGPGKRTATLAERWPEATVVGVDSSTAMIEAARDSAFLAGKTPYGEAFPAGKTPHGEAFPAGKMPYGEQGSRLSFELGDIAEWEPAAPLDVLVSNAALQWLPSQLDALARWARLLAPGGWLAVQAPGNNGQPAHVILRELVMSARWRSLLDGVVLNRQAADPADYLDRLAAAGCQADAWETTYLHVLSGDNAVLEWYKGTGLRPVIDALPPDLTGEFLAEYGARLREAYPARPYGTVLPFRRVFVVAQRS